MKKITKLFIAISAVLLIATSVMTYLFISKNKDYNKQASFSRTCIQSFMTSVDLLLCEEDMFLDNVKPGACTTYKDLVTEDIKFAVKAGYTSSYNYIGAK